MANTFQALNAYTGYLPQLTGQVIAFAQDQSKFTLNQYVQFVKTDEPFGLYQELGRDEFVRVESVDQDVWEDGDLRNRGDQVKVTSQMIPFRTQRRNRAAVLGYKAIETTKGWKPKVAHTKACVTQTLTATTQRVISLLTTGSNWTTRGGFSSPANTLNGGKGSWANSSADPASPNYNAIWATLTQALALINLNTNSVVELDDLRFLVGPMLAIAMSQTPEMVEYCRSSPYSKEILEKGLDPQYTRWGLPSTYKGAHFIVEAAPIVSSNPTVDSSGNWTEQVSTNPSSTTANRRFIMPPNQCIVLSRPGALEGEASGAPNFSTVQVYYYKERMTVEGFNNPEHRIFTTDVSVDQIEVVASPISGGLITGCQ